jgi:hypothetical protein
MIREEIKSWTDADGLVSHSRTFPGQRNASGNGLLYTSLYYILLSRLGLLSRDDRDTFASIIVNCQVDGGLLKRGPIHPDQEGPDDYIGVLAASKVINVDIARRILFRARRWLPIPWHMNNTSPGSLFYPDGRFNFSAIFLRFPALICHAYECAGFRPNPFLRLCRAVVLWLSGRGRRSASQDEWVLSWLILSSIGEPNAIEKMVIENWEKRLSQSPFLTLRSALAAALKPNHPVVLYWKD